MRRYCCLLLIISFGAAPKLRAENSQTIFVPNEFEWYLGPLVCRRALGGDFDGDSAFIGTTNDGPAVLVVPSVEAGLGAGLVAGVKNRVTRSFAVAGEISYAQSKHKVSWLDEPGDAIYRLLSFDLKGYFHPLAPAQPYLQLGYGIPSVKIEDGYLSMTKIKDLTYIGNNINLGGGMQFYMSHAAAFHVAAIYRIARFDTVDFGSRVDLPRKLNSQSVDFEIGVTFRFSSAGPNNR